MSSPANRIKALRAPDGALDIPIIGEVYGWFADELIRLLMSYKPTEVRFIMRSPGGLAFEVMDVVDYMNANGIKSYSEIYGECASAATFLAAHSTPERTAVTKSTRFGIHRASGPIGDDVFVTHANERIIELYRKAYGWSEAKAVKFLDANNGTGSAWIGEDIVSTGIAAELLDELKVAASMSRVVDIINTKLTMKVKAKLVSNWSGIKALAGSEVEVEVDAKDVEAATSETLKTAQTELAQAVSDRQAAETKEKEATDKVTALQAQVDQAKPTIDKLTEEKATAEASVSEVTAKLTDETKKVTAHEATIATLNAEIAKLRKLPTASSINLSGDAPEVDPGGSPSELTGGQKLVKNLFDGMSDLEKAEYRMRLKEQKEKQTQAKA